MASLFKRTQAPSMSGEAFNAIAESTFTDNAICELTMELFHIAECSDIAGVVGGYAVFEGTAQADVVLENILTTSWEKMKQAYKKFAAKMKAFFEKVRKVLKSFFLKGKEFVNEFKAELTKKDKGDFTYEGYVYTIDKGDATSENLFSDVETRINSLLAFAQKKVDYKDILNDTDAFKKELAKVSKVDTVENFSDATAKAMAKAAGLKGVTNVTELKDELVLAYRNGDDTKTTVEKFEEISVSDMCAFILESDKKIAGFNKDERNFETTINKIIKVIDSLSGKKGETDAETQAYKLMSKLSGNLTALLNLGKAPVDVKVAIYKEAASQYESVLKSFLRYNPKKATTESTAVSLVDQMLGF